MNQRTLLLIAAGITAFVLVLTGGLVSRMSTATATPAAATTEAAAAPAPLDPTVEALIREREAAYQAALAEANTRLTQANAQIAATNQQAAQAAPAAQPMVAYDGSAEAAAAIALQYLGGGEVRDVEQETERGIAVYEVQFTDGAEVYVEAQTGQVVYAEQADAADEHED